MDREQIIERLGVEKPLSRSKQEILALGAAAIPLLISILADEELIAAEHTTGGWAPIHAATLLGELHAEISVISAIPTMLGILHSTPWDTIVHDRVMVALAKLGALVVEPVLTTYAGVTATPPDSPDVTAADVRESLASVLASCGVRDERIYDLLASRFAAGLDPTGLDLSTYGDPRALPLLSRAYDAMPIVENDVAFANRDLLDLKEAIEVLGGELTVEQEAKFEIAMAPVTSEAQQPATRRERPGRNDPCWCGSKTKYKKCHLEADERAARNE